MWFLCVIRYPGLRYELSTSITLLLVEFVNLSTLYLEEENEDISMTTTVLPEVWLHRCYTPSMEGNTIAGCVRAINIGFDGIEIDVRYRDSEFYLAHDEDEIDGSDHL